MPDISYIIEDLNDEQVEAVLAPARPLMVLAGAGSGKTRVLTHRIAYLLSDGNVRPWQIMAVTFTNKAAREMRERIESLIGPEAHSIFVGTFHGLSHRILRSCTAEAGLRDNFEIIASADQLRIIKTLIADNENHYLSGEVEPGKVQWSINAKKEKGTRASGSGKSADPNEEFIEHIYREYERYCESEGLVDFAELLLRVVELMRNNVTVREKYQNRFLHILADEYQDTNEIQFQWLKLFCAGHESITVVGDDDQSIYGWRGARVENMIQFEREFPNAATIRLEQNYRSTVSILSLANSLIAGNRTRLGKTLWTDGESGESVRFSNFYNETREAEFAADRIDEIRASGKRYDDIAVLYRTNAQSRIFEEIFSSRQIPYQVYGGLRFFERLEVMAVMAYLRLLVNPDSNNAFLRVVNLPARGIGKAALVQLKLIAAEHEVSMWEAVRIAVADSSTPRQLVSRLSGFTELISRLTGERKILTLPELVSSVIGETGLKEHYRKSKSQEAVSRVENLDELIPTAERYKSNSPLEDNAEILEQFLADASLDAGDRHLAKDGNVQLMTLHNAKGLEFPAVFLTGMVEGLLPHWNAMERGEIEEERRLCYVGITRAIETLHLTATRVRNVRGMFNMQQKQSRFIAEVEDQLAGWDDDDDNHPTAAYDFSDSGSADSDSIVVGLRVKHRNFGTGTVAAMQRSGGHSLARVQFDRGRSKWIVATSDHLRRA